MLSGACPVCGKKTLTFELVNGGKYTHCMGRRVSGGRIEGCTWTYESEAEVAG